MSEAWFLTLISILVPLAGAIIYDIYSRRRDEADRQQLLLTTMRHELGMNTRILEGNIKQLSHELDVIRNNNHHLIGLLAEPLSNLVWPSLLLNPPKSLRSSGAMNELSAVINMVIRVNIVIRTNEEFRLDAPAPGITADEEYGPLTKSDTYLIDYSQRLRKEIHALMGRLPER